SADRCSATRDRCNASVDTCNASVDTCNTPKDRCNTPKDRCNTPKDRCNTPKDRCSASGDTCNAPGDRYNPFTAGGTRAGKRPTPSLPSSRLRGRDDGREGVGQGGSAPSPYSVPGRCLAGTMFSASGSGSCSMPGAGCSSVSGGSEGPAPGRSSGRSSGRGSRSMGVGGGAPQPG